MKIFSFFGAADDDVQGSYCESEGRHVDYIDEEDVEDEIDSAEERGDEVDYSDRDFDDSCINVRHDEDGRSVVSGPSKPWWMP